MANFKRIVVHAGQAHADDLTALACALTLEGDAPVYRRDPRPEELDNPNVLVMDVGGRLDAASNNYDHHQIARDAEPACALTLYLGARHPEVLKKLRRFTKWLSPLEYIDSKGPFAYAKANGLSSFPFGLLGGLDGALKGLVERMTRPDDGGLNVNARAMLLALGEQLLLDLDAKASAMALLEKNAVILDAGNGVKGVLFESKDSSALQQFRDELAARPEGLTLAFSVTLDDRGAGMALYRFNDHPKLDFSRLNGREEIEFAHAGGFIAKTKKTLAKEEIVALVQAAMK